jgi:outer membrane protein assembly factor BamA
LKIEHLLSFLFIFYCSDAHAQNSAVKINNKELSNQNTLVIDSSKQRDLADEIYKLLGKNELLKKAEHPKKINFSVIPAIGYTLTTGFAFDLTGNAAFYTSKSHTENLSAIVTDLAFDTKKQKLLVTRSEIWADQNDYKFVSDIRVENFPTETYGLGTNTTTAQTNDIDYDYLKFYGTLYRRLVPDFYVGAGYDLDYHYNITANGNLDNTVSDFEKYGQTKQSTSSGLNLDALYDSRRNPINPLGGTYAGLTYRQNFTFIGSNADWRSVELDLRKYVKLSPNSNNILAFWAIAWASSSGTPYLDLPNTGGDMYNNSGRGYAEGRFRGKDMLYIESEYRFGITKNGLLGGVVFANGESLTGYPSNNFQKIAPATGAGIRIKANKHSDSNIAIDYGVGIDHSRGFFVNLGEMF